MKEKVKKLCPTFTDVVILGILCLIFGYFCIFHEVKPYGDSHQYLVQMVSREPLYPLLLQILMVLFKSSYTIVLGIIQNVMAIASIYWIYRRLQSLFDVKKWEKFVILAILLAPHLLTPLSSQTRMIITNAIMTEGIAVSLYYVWFGLLLQFILRDEHQNIKNAMLVLLYSVILSMIRGQFIVCFALWILAVGFVLCKKKQFKRLLYALLLLFVAFAFKTQVTKVYNYLESGLYVNTVSSKPMLLANAVYVADLSAEDNIQDPKLKEAFHTIMQGVEQEKLTVKYATGNIISRARFHEAGHETINFDHIVPALKTYMKEKDGIEEDRYSLLLVKMDEYAQDIFKDILPDIVPAFIKNYFVITSLGFVRSVAIDRSFLPIYAVAVYVLAIVLMIFLLHKKRDCSSALFMLTVLVLICGTVFGTSVMIECISRYMIYNLPLFYIAGMMMIKDLLRTADRRVRK